MPVEILMPTLSPSMTEGNIAGWMKKEGDAVKAGEVLAEVETDKATIEFEATEDGTLGKILVAAGSQGIKVDQPIAILLKPGEDAAALAGTAVKGKPESSPVSVAATASAVVADIVQPPKSGRLAASPLARRMARDTDTDLKTLSGSGPHGRILRNDVMAAVALRAARRQELAPSATSTESAAAMPADKPAFGPAFTEVPLSAMRNVIARRLTEAKQTVPHFYLSIDIELDALLSVRATLNAQADPYKLSVNDFVVRAVALALKKVPAANASFTETAIRLYSDVDISVAVATPNGLITPIVRHADNKGLAAISNEVKELAGKAREGKLKPEEFQGGSFTISNLGMFGVKNFAAIINPPQGCILAVGAGEPRPVVKDGALAVATVMTCTLSVDHRVVDGAVGAEFLSAFKALIQDPLSMLL